MPYLITTLSFSVPNTQLKPANLLIDHSGVLEISDFGLSKVRPNLEMAEKDTFTMTGETGSYRFMAPEGVCHLCLRGGWTTCRYLMSHFIYCFDSLVFIL